MSSAAAPVAPGARARGHGRMGDAGLQAALFLVAAGLAASTLRWGISPHDEGIMLAWGRRVAGGQWPYRDFWSNYPPGQTLVTALLIKLFGQSLLVWRIVRVLVGAAASLLAFWLVRRDAGTRVALAAWAAVAGAMAWPLTPGPNALALALALGAPLAARRHPVAGGALAGLAFATRYEVGVAAALAAMLATGERRAAGRAALAATAVAAACLLPFAVVAGGQMLDQTIGFLGVAGLQRLPFPLSPSGVGLDPNKLLELWIPAILVAGSALWLAWALLRRPRAPGWAMAPLIAVGLAYLLSRTDEFHLVPLAPALAVGCALAAGAERARPRSSRALQIALLGVVALIALHGWERQAGILRHPPARAAVPGGVGDGVTTDPAQAAALRALIPRVRALTPGGEPVLVAPPRYDRVRVGDPLLNVLLDRPNPTRYDVIQPGVVTTAKVQREMVRDLARTNVVVRWLGAAARRVEPNGSGRSSGVRLLDDAIAREFRPLARYGDFLVLVRRRYPRRGRQRAGQPSRTVSWET